MKHSQQYLLVINRAPLSMFEVTKNLRQQSDFANLTLLILTATPRDYTDLDEPVVVVECTFETDEEIATALEPYRKDIRGVICRGDRYIQDLRKVIPFLPESVLVSTPESLDVATNKRLMRMDFMQHYPEITPHFIEVHDDSLFTIEKIENHLQYPVIVKPANLASSLLIQSCHDRPELQAALTKIFEKIQEIYTTEGRRHKPQVIVEEYLEGEFYSIDAYVTRPGEISYCPPVAYIPAKQLGIDDFFLYKRFVPTHLTQEQVVAANETTAKAITAVGLTHTVVHVELILTKHGWKIIELGPRLGRFRVTMYKWGYGIDHSKNDVLIHVGQKPIIKDELLRYCAAYSIYPKKEGVLRGITGLELLENNQAVKYLKIVSKPGMLCTFAKHGGHALAEFIIATDDKAEYEKLVAKIEESIEAVID